MTSFVAFDDEWAFEPPYEGWISVSPPSCTLSHSIAPMHHPHALPQAELDRICAAHRTVTRHMRYMAYVFQKPAESA